MKIKVSEATGAVLDWMVAKAEGWTVEDHIITHVTTKFYNPSSNWVQGGPIIEREKIGFDECFGTWAADWYAPKNSNRDGISMLGKSPLEAAMRCYVASKLGDEVEVPDELVKE